MKRIGKSPCLRLTVILIMIATALTNAYAQKMDFSFSGLTGVKTNYLKDGTTLVQLPASASFANMSSYGMSVTADGQSANLTDIVPNPATKTDYVDGALNVFYYKGKAYKVRFSVGEYFTAVFFTDAKMGGLTDINTQLEFYAQRMAAMGKGGANYTFDALPGYIPTADIAFFMGDMYSSNSSTPIIHTNTTDYMNVVAKCAVVTGQFESYGTNATVTEYGLCYATTENPTTSNTYKAAADIAVADDTFGDELKGMFGVYFDNLTAQTTYHVRAYCKYTLNGTSYTTYGEDRTITTPAPSGMTWAWEGGETPDATTKARIEEAMNGAKEYYNNYCTLYKWAGTCYNSGVQTADCSLRADQSCYIRFGPNSRYQWVGTAQHELSHGYGVGQTSAYSGYPNPFQFKRATLTLRVFLQDMTMLISHDSMHYWPGGINQREEVTNGTANNKGTYTCKNEEMLKCNAMILNGLALDGMKTTYGWTKERNSDTWTGGEEQNMWVKGCMEAIEGQTTWAASRNAFDQNQNEQRNNAPRKVTGQSAFENGLNAFNLAGIPLILAPGEIDLATAANAAGKTLNTTTFDVVTRALTEAQTHGVSDVTRFTNGQSTTTQIQAQPFAFKFKDVRFYNGQNNWFYEPMYNSGNTYRWIVPDAIYSSLQTYVNSHRTETSIWMQHIPMNASDADWYTSKSTYNATNTSRTATSAYNSATKRRTAINSLITSTANAAMFSGHAGTYNDNYYGNKFHDYTIPAINNTPGDAIIVLMKAGTGVIEVKQVDFRNYEPFFTQFEDVATEYTANQDNALLAGLVQGLTNLNTGNASITSALSTAQNVNTVANVTSSISALNSAFQTYANSQTQNFDVTGLLGDNNDFETTIGAQSADRAEVYEIPGWNEYVNAATSTWQFLEYKTNLESPSGGNAIYIRENWKGNPALASTVQLYKDAVLPAGTYLLQFDIRQPGANQSESLNYYEINGVRTSISTATTWETKQIPITLDQPSTIRLSFGFKGSTTEGNYPCEVDVDGIKLTYTVNEVAQGKASMEEPWELMTAKPQDYSPYFFALFDHTQDLGLVRKAGANQGADYQAMWYAANTTPGLDKTAIWTFDSNVNDNTEYVVMTNASYPDYMYQTEWNAAYNFRTHDNGGNDGDLQWGRTLLAYNDGKWSIQNGKYPDEGYLGAWNGTIADGAETALNKTGNNIGYFDIYRILRGEYVATYEPLLNASEDNPLNISYVLENPGGERRSTVGWKTDGAGWWKQNSNALNGKVGTYFLESWNGSGLSATDIYQTIQGLPDGTYRFSAIAHCTTNCLLYANDEQVAAPTNNPGTRTNVIVVVTDGNLRVGMKTGSNPGSWIAFDDAKLEYLGGLTEYNVGVPQTNIEEGNYIQNLTEVTYNFTMASASDASASFAKLNNNAKVALYKGSTKVAESSSLNLSGKVLTATFSGITLDTNSNYSIQLPADVVGYAGHVANEAMTINVHTPILFDTSCYLLNNSTNKYLSRNGLWNTQAVADDYGVAVNVVTDAMGNTHLQCFDNLLYVYDDGNAIFADGGTGLNLTPVVVAGGYRFQNKANNNYLGIDGNVISANKAASDPTTVWTFEPFASHTTVYTTNANVQAAKLATDASISGVTSLSALESKLTTDYYSNGIDITGSKAEKFQVYGNVDADGTDVDYYTETVENLKPGIYRLTVDAFQRAAYNERVAGAGGARGLIFVYANDAKTQLKSVMDYAASSAYSNDYEYNGSHYPNDEASAYVALETGNYQNVVYVYVPADEGETTGTLKFGIKIENRLGNNVVGGTWAAYDNFRLEYLSPIVVLDESSTTAPEAATNAKVRVIRSIVSKNNNSSGNAWNTVCFPFSMTDSQIEESFGNVRIMELQSVTLTGDHAAFKFKDVDEITANVPCIMQADNASTGFELSGVNIMPVENANTVTITVNGVDFVGTYVAQTPMPNTNGSDYYISNDVFKKSSGNTKIKGFRGYFHVPNASSIKSLSMDIDGQTTFINLIDSDDVLTMPADIYSVGGQLIRRQSTTTDDLPAGIYIVNGRKVIKR